VGDLARVYCDRACFTACALIRIADDTLLAVSVGDRAEQAEAAPRATAAWREQQGRTLTGCMEQHLGVVAFWWDLAPLGVRLAERSLSV
jgi:hypothetical protein